MTLSWNRDYSLNEDKFSVGTLRGRIKADYANQMTLSWNRDYSLNEDKFSVGTLRGRIKADYAKSAMEQYFDKTVFRFGAAKVVYKHGKFFLHISVSCDVNELQASDVCNVVGHDRGIRFITASYGSNGKTLPEDD